MYLLDTNVISELRKGMGCDARVTRWYADCESDQLYLSVFVLGEIWRGVTSIAGRDSARAAALTTWYKTIKHAYAGRILGVSEAVAERWGEFNRRRTYPVLDALLAATAHVHQLVLVTRNSKDIAGTEVRFINPFESRRVHIA